MGWIVCVDCGTLTYDYEPIYEDDAPDPTRPSYYICVQCFKKRKTLTTTQLVEFLNDLEKRRILKPK